MREVAGEFGGPVVLREYCSDNKKVRDEYGIYRRIFINGQEVGWGPEAPKDALRAEVEKAKRLIAPAG